jgi:hypothetical protein
VIAVAAFPGSDGGSHITQAEWIAAAVAAIVTSVGVGAKGNAPKPPVVPGAPGGNTFFGAE